MQENSRKLYKMVQIVVLFSAVILVLALLCRIKTSEAMKISEVIAKNKKLFLSQFCLPLGVFLVTFGYLAIGEGQ